MDKVFIEVSDEKGHQMFLNVNLIATFKQASGNNSPTEITFSGGHKIIISTQYPTFRKILGLDK